jgi:hypothetical protein
LGAIIAIDTDNQFFSNLEKVNYNDKRPSIDVNINSYSEREEVDLGKMIFYSKSTSWSYEKEYRDLKLLDDSALLDTTDGNGCKVCLFNLPKESIKGLTFGAKLTMKEKKCFLSNLGTLEYEIEIREAKLNNLYFSLDINPFNGLN